ncbi:hypothetical protein JW905_01605 [bacterium]|nr:hypothetical protein [candidate division CSSED10-310 bacterium]
MRRRSSLAMVMCVLLPAVFLAVGCENTTKMREADTFKKAENYEDAIAKYKEFLSENPETSHKDEVMNSIAECYYNWATVNKRVRKFQDAIDQLELLMKEYRGSPFYTDAMRNLPSAYLELGRQLRAGGDFIGASKALNTVVERFRGNVNATDAERELENIGILVFSAGNVVWGINADGSAPTKLRDPGFDADLSRSGKSLAYIKPDSPNDAVGKLELFDMKTGEEDELSRYPNAAYPVLTPSSRYVALRKGKNFQVINIEEHKPYTYESMKAVNRIGDWSVDNQQLVGFGHASGPAPYRVCVIESAFDSYFVLATMKKPIRAAAWSPEGRTILFVTADGLYVVSPEGGEPTPFIVSEEHDNIDIRAMDLSPDGKNMIVIAKRANDEKFGFFSINLDKTINPIEVKLPEDVELNPDRISWGLGHL